MLLEFPKEGYDRRREGSVGKLQRKIIKRPVDADHAKV